MQTASATWQVKQAAMFINVIETDDLIHYGSNCSPLPLRFPDLNCKGKRTGFSAFRGVRAAFSLLGSILHTLLYSAVQMFQETSIRFTWLSHCVQLAFLLTPVTYDAGAHITGFALCNSLYQAEFFLTAPFTLVELLLEISLAPKTASVWPTTCNAHYWWIIIHL